MGEAIPVIEALSLKLSELQTRFPLDTTFNHTELDNLPGNLGELLNNPPTHSGDDPATGFITECTN